MKLMICPKNKDIENFKNLGVKDYLFGLKDFSCNFENEVTIEELEELTKSNPDVNFFVSMNKNLFNNEIELVKEILFKLDTLSIAGIFYYDLAILSIHNDYKLHTPLVWNQTHMVTNYNTCNYYLEQGSEYAHIAPEITLDEILEIRGNSSIKMIVTVFGYPVISHSKRKLLTNYFQFLRGVKSKRTYTLTESTKHPYLIKEDNSGASIYDGLLLNGTSVISALAERDVEYALLMEEEVERKVMEEIIVLYNAILNKEIAVEEAVTKSIGICGSSNTGFFFKKTIYKVKKNG